MHDIVKKIREQLGNFDCKSSRYAYEIRYDGSLYEGEQQEDEANGKGRLIEITGDVYTGDWKDDMKHGIGQLKLNDGTYYDGSWY